MHVDLSRLPVLKARGLSDQAIARIFHCSSRTVLNYRRRLGIGCTKWQIGRAEERRAREAELDRLWARLSLDEKLKLLLRAGSD